MFLRTMVATTLVFLSVQASARGEKEPPSHCRPGEREIFSCQIKKSANVASV